MSVMNTVKDENAMAELKFDFCKEQNNRLYSGGSIESEMLSMVKRGSVNWYEDGRWPVVYHFSPLRQNILNWYPFDRDGELLEVGAGCGALTGLFCDRVRHVTALELTEIRSRINYERHKDRDNLDIYICDIADFKLDKRFDYIIVNGVLEYAALMFKGNEPYVEFLSVLKNFLKPDGVILLAIENRIGLKYLAGSREDHLGTLFSGVNGYGEDSEIRTFSHSELEEKVKKAGLCIKRDYYPFPDYKFPVEIFTRETINHMQLSECSRDLHLDMEWWDLFSRDNLQNTLAKERVAECFANSFLMELGFHEESRTEDISYVRISQNREKCKCILTIVDQKNQRVLKKPLYPEGYEHVTNMLKYQGVHGEFCFIPGREKAGGAEFPFLKSENLYTRLLGMNYQRQSEEFTNEVLRHCDRIAQSAPDSDGIDIEAFERIFGTYSMDEEFHWKKGLNIDLIAENVFIENGTYSVIDYEWCFDFPIPVEYAIWRVVRQLQVSCMNMDFEKIFKKLGITEKHQQMFKRWDAHFVMQYVGCINMGRLSQPRGTVCYYTNEQMNALLQEKQERSNTEAALRAQLSELTKQMEVNQRHAANEIQKVSGERDEWKALYDDILRSQSWKLTAPLRCVARPLKAVKRRFGCAAIMVKKGMRSVKQNGFSVTLQKVKKRIPRKMALSDTEQLQRQRETTFEQMVKFSILVPVFNTPKVYLEAMIQSVLDQTYRKWELCLTDASDAAHAYVGTVCREYQKRDARIVYKRLDENLGIAENTNQCAKMATGEYIVLLDHDDLLTVDALYENVKAINECQADILYSDEDHLSLVGNFINPFFKPDWSPDLLYSQMYVCHLLVFRAELFRQIGGFCSTYNGAQDYDLMLRFSEHTSRIHHIPKILYHWRESENSTAMNADSKPYAHEAGRKALDAHLKRKYQGKAYAEDGSYLFTYVPRFCMDEEPLVSIIIPMKDKWELTQACVESILEKTQYQNYEILILDNCSELIETQRWLDQAALRNDRIRILKADMEFNWSKINNFGIRNAKGDVFIFLNNDTVVISPEWLGRLTENAVRDEIGVVGPLLLYEDGTIQHAGVVVGFGGWADHVFKGMKAEHNAAMFASPMVSRNVLAVTGACMAVSRKTLEKIGGFDETFVICGSDTELCIRAYEKGFFNRYDANVRLYHLESKSRNSFIPEIDFKRSYACYTPYRENGDPFYNCNLDLNSTTPKEKC